MPKVRGSVKSRRTGGKKGWPSKTRSFPWRKGSARPAMALSGMKRGVSSAASVHRFTRWASTTEVDVYDVGGGAITSRVTNEDAGTTTAIVVGGPTVNGPGGAASGYQLGGAISFQLNNVPAYTDFTGLFNHYTIEQVDIEVDCLSNSAGLSSGQVMPTITYVPDFDDASVPTTGASISEYQRAKTWTFRGSGHPLKFSIKPRTAITVFRSAVTSAYAAGAEGTSLNLGYVDVPHYGIKFWLDNMQASSGAGVQLRFKMKYHLKFQDPK